MPVRGGGAGGLVSCSCHAQPLALAAQELCGLDSEAKEYPEDGNSLDLVS